MISNDVSENHEDFFVDRSPAESADRRSFLDPGDLEHCLAQNKNKVNRTAPPVALHFMFYNFVRIHKTLRVTPAMAAGVTDRLWEIEDLVGLAP